MSQSHPLRALLTTQFLGAFNDNAWKLIVIVLGFRAAHAASGGAADPEEGMQLQTTLAFAVLTVPLMLFSLPAGVLADRISKRSVIVAMNLAMWRGQSN